MAGGGGLIGSTISHYRILEKLGEGGMGVVYKAEDTRLDRMVALKLLPAHLAGDEEARRRLLREARAAARLDHPNICLVHEVDEVDGQTLLAMQFVDGQSVRDKIAERPLPVETALDIAIQVARGLQTAHERGITHRDIKPGNILLTRSGHVKITDFGLAQADDATRLTQAGQAVGTPAYMSPEQAMGRPADRRSDLYSLGVVLYEMISGRLPAVVQPEPLTALRSGLPRDLDRVVAKAMRADPAERYQNAADLAVDLQRLPSPTPRRPASRRWVLGAAGAAATCGAVAISWFRPDTPTTLSTGSRASNIPEANEYYERAFMFLGPRFDVLQARKLLEHAMAIDPQFQSARALYAFTHVLMIESGLSNDPALLYQAEQEAREVLREDPRNGRAHGALAAAYATQGRNELASAAVDAASGADQRELSGRVFFALSLYRDGQYDRAMEMLREMLARDPLFFPARMAIGDGLRQQGDYEGALRELDKTLEQDPQLLGPLLMKAMVLMDQNQMEASRATLEQLRPESRTWYNVRLAWALQYALEGNRDAAFREMDAGVLKYAEFARWTTHPAEFYALLGDATDALNWLEKAVRMGDNRAEWFERDPLLAKIRGEPRFRQIVEVARHRRGVRP